MDSPTSEEDSSALRQKIENLKRTNKKKSKQEKKKKQDSKESKKKSNKQKKLSESNDNGVQQPMLSDVEVFSDGSPATDSSEYSSRTRPRSDSVKLRKKTGSHKRMGSPNWEGRMSRDFTEEMFKSVDLVDEMIKLRDGVEERDAGENDGSSRYEEVFTEDETEGGEVMQKDETIEHELIDEEEKENSTKNVQNELEAEIAADSEEEFGRKKPQNIGPSEEDSELTVEEYLQQYENEDNREENDSKLEMENAADLEDETRRKGARSISPAEEDSELTVDEYLQQCENEDHGGKSDFKLEKAADLEDETSRKESESISPAEEDSELTVDEYLQQCENEDHGGRSDFKLEKAADLEDETSRKESESISPAEEDSELTGEEYLKQYENEDNREENDSKFEMENAADLKDETRRKGARSISPAEVENAMTVEEYLQQYENEDSREENDSLQMTPKQSESNKNDEKIDNCSLASFEAKDEMFEEDASDYLSVASNRYSSFESLDEAKIREMSSNRDNLESKHRFDRDRMNSDGPFDVHTERKRRLLESEADRTEDEYLTAEERSVISVSESRNMSISTEIDTKERPFESEADRTEDEYLTADEQSVVSADDRRDDFFEDYEDRGFDDGSRKTSILANDDRKQSYDDDDANASEKEERFSVVSSRGDFIGTEDQTEEGEDDRNTIVGSDDAVGDDLDVEQEDEAEPRFELSKQVSEDEEVRSNGDEDNHITKSEETQAVIESVDKEHEISVAEETNVIASSEKMRKRKTSFFSSMMTKKEMKYAERFAGYDERFQFATKGAEDARRRFTEAKSNLPLMIIEQRVPKMEVLVRLNFKLQEMEKRLETVQIFNKRTNDYIQQWRTIDGQVQEKRIEVAQYSRKTSEKQKLLMACKKRHGFLHSSIIRQEDLQQQSLRRIAQLTDRLDMLRLRQTEQRNIVTRRIEQAKKSCEASVRAAARVVVTSKRVQMLKEKQREMEEKVVRKRKEIKKLKKNTKEKEFDLERTVVQKSVKAMKKERGW